MRGENGSADTSPNWYGLTELSAIFLADTLSNNMSIFIKVINGKLVLVLASFSHSLLRRCGYYFHPWRPTGLTGGCKYLVRAVSL